MLLLLAGEPSLSYKELILLLSLQEFVSSSSISSTDTEILGALDPVTLLPCMSAPHLKKKNSPTAVPQPVHPSRLSIRGFASLWDLLLAQHGEGLQS